MSDFPVYSLLSVRRLPLPAILVLLYIPEELAGMCVALKTPAIIAVSGFGGAGKSTFADLLGSATNVPVIRLDSFACERLEYDSIWESMDSERLKREVLVLFSKGEKTISYGAYDWEANEVTKMKSVEMSGRLIIEGVGLLPPDLDKYFSYKIVVDFPKEEAVRRGKKRDREVYKNPRDEKGEGIWMKNDTGYLEAFRPKETADLVVSNCD